MFKELHNQSVPNNRSRDLLLSILFDAVGMLSFSIPLIGEFSDVVWAPISALLMMQMYKGGKGKLAGILSFLEEIIPFTDFIPSFTLMWLYTYVFTKKQY
jgi:hypothetical protein